MILGYRPQKSSINQALILRHYDKNRITQLDNELIYSNVQLHYRYITALDIYKRQMKLI